MRVAVAALGVSWEAVVGRRSGGRGWRLMRPWRLRMFRPEVVVVVGDIESADFPLLRLVGMARRYPVLVLSPSSMRSAIATARACGARGYQLGDAPADEVAAALREVAAGRDAWPRGWIPTPDDQPADTPPRRVLASLVLMVTWPLVLVWMHASLGMAALGGEVTSLVGLGWVWQGRAAEYTRLVNLTAARARAAERAAYSRALHDRTLQTLEMLAAQSDLADGDLRCHLDNEARWLRELVESGVEKFAADVVEAIGAVVRRNSRAAFVVAFKHQIDQSQVVPPAVVAALAGAVSEALTNVAKHAGVDRAEVIVRGERSCLAVEVIDSGCGIGAARAKGAGFGIRHSIQGRVSAVGGKAVVRSGPRGTVVRLTYPAEKPDQAERRSG